MGLESITTNKASGVDGIPVELFHIVNGAAMNNGVHVSLSILVSSVCMPCSGIAGSYGSSISSFLQSWTKAISRFSVSLPGTHTGSWDLYGSPEK